jgi:hypothetical protein
MRADPANLACLIAMRLSLAGWGCGQSPAAQTDDAADSLIDQAIRQARQSTDALRVAAQDAAAQVAVQGVPGTAIADKMDKLQDKFDSAATRSAERRQLDAVIRDPATDAPTRLRAIQLRDYLHEHKLTMAEFEARLNGGPPAPARPAPPAPNNDRAASDAALGVDPLRAEREERERLLSIGMFLTPNSDREAERRRLREVLRDPATPAEGRQAAALLLAMSDQQPGIKPSDLLADLTAGVAPDLPSGATGNALAADDLGDLDLPPEPPGRHPAADAALAGAGTSLPTPSADPLRQARARLDSQILSDPGADAIRRAIDSAPVAPADPSPVEPRWTVDQLQSHANRMSTGARLAADDVRAIDAQLADGARGADRNRLLADRATAVERIRWHNEQIAEDNRLLAQQGVAPTTPFFPLPGAPPGGSPTRRSASDWRDGAFDALPVEVGAALRVTQQIANVFTNRMLIGGDDGDGVVTGGSIGGDLAADTTSQRLAHAQRAGRHASDPDASVATGIADALGDLQGLAQGLQGVSSNVQQTVTGVRQIRTDWQDWVGDDRGGGPGPMRQPSPRSRHSAAARDAPGTPSSLPPPALTSAPTPPGSPASRERPAHPPPFAPAPAPSSRASNPNAPTPTVAVRPPPAAPPSSSSSPGARPVLCGPRSCPSGEVRRHPVQQLQPRAQLWRVHADRGRIRHPRRGGVPSATSAIPGQSADFTRCGRAMTPRRDLPSFPIAEARPSLRPGVVASPKPSVLMPGECVHGWLPRCLPRRARSGVGFEFRRKS